MVVFTSDLRDGNRHAPRNLPVLFAGRGGGRIKQGQNLSFTKETPLANLYLTMLHTMGIEMNQFGDSTSTMSQLMI